MNINVKWLCALTCLLFFGWKHVSAQSNFQVHDNNIHTDFPKLIDFRLDVSGPEELESITLIYGTNAHSCQQSGSRQPVTFESDTEASVSWEWDLQRSGSLPPGSLVWWEWEIKDVAGNTHRTERIEMPFADDRYRWRSVSSEGVTVHWYFGDRSFGEDTHANTIASLQRLQAILGVPVPENIHLWIYPTADDIRDALARSSDWTGAVAFTRYATMLISLEPGEDAWSDEVIAHELTHLMVRLATFNCRGGDIPVWLNEGLATFAEPELDGEGIANVQEALADGRLPPLRSLADGFSAYGGGARLAYAQSGEVVRYLIAEYGPESMNDLMMAVREGITIDQALEQVYRLDTDLLDARWRQSTGFPATPTREASGDGSTTTPTLVPTLALGGGPMVIASATATVSPSPPTKTPIPTEMPPSTTPTLTATKTAVPPATPAQAVAAIITPTRIRESSPEIESERPQFGWIWWVAGILAIMAGTTVIILRKQKGG